LDVAVVAHFSPVVTRYLNLASTGFTSIHRSTRGYLCASADAIPRIRVWTSTLLVALPDAGLGQLLRGHHDQIGGTALRSLIPLKSSVLATTAAQRPRTVRGP
jgi:hypothetical protein